MGENYIFYIKYNIYDVERDFSQTMARGKRESLFGACRDQNGDQIETIDESNRFDKNNSRIPPGGFTDTERRGPALSHRARVVLVWGIRDSLAPVCLADILSESNQLPYLIWSQKRSVSEGKEAGKTEISRYKSPVEKTSLGWFGLVRTSQ